MNLMTYSDLYAGSHTDLCENLCFSAFDFTHYNIKEQDMFVRYTVHASGKLHNKYVELSENNIGIFTANASSRSFAHPFHASILQCYLYYTYVFFRLIESKLQINMNALRA